MRKLATAAAAFSAAIFLAQYAIPGGWLPLCAGICAALALLGLLLRANARLRVLLVFFGLAAGLLYNWGYSEIFFAPAEALCGRTEAVSAAVCGYPEAQGRGSRVTIRLRPDGGPAVKASLYIFGEAPDLRPGDVISLTAEFEYADELYGSDTDYYSSRGVFLLAKLSGDMTVESRGGGLRYAPARMAKALRDKISDIFPPDAVGFMQALLTGDRTLIRADELLDSSLKVSGVSHVISVSGMHVAFLMGFLSLFIKNRRRLAVAGIPVILFFMAFIGFTPSVCRAGIMQIFVLTAPLVKRESDPLTALFFALALILGFNPYSAASIGLQLSFAACLGMILFTGRIYEALFEAVKCKRLCAKKLPKAAARFVVAGLSTTLGALCFTVPLTALYFGYVSLVAPLANLLTLWAVSLAFCGGYIACLLGFVFAPLGTAAAFAVTLPVRFVVRAVFAMAGLPLAAVYTANAAIVCWLVYVYVMLIAFFALRGTLRQLLYPACAATISLCVILVATSLAAPSPGGGSLSATVLDVGQGQSIVLTAGGRTALVDCGSSSGGDAGAVAGGCLYAGGRHRVDLLILTHFHADHANGVDELAAMTDITAIAMPEPAGSDAAAAEDIKNLAESRGIEIIYVTQDMTVDFGGSTLYLYAPLGTGSENERGLFVLCTEGDYDVLITGDAPSAMEYRLLDHADLPDIELLVVGHHGSAGSTSQELLEAVRPEAAVISVGENDYGHPTPEALARLAENRVKVYRTDESGSLTFTH